MRIVLGRKWRVAASVAATIAALASGIGSAYADDPASDVQPNVIGGNPPTQNYPGGAKVSLQYDAPAHGRDNWHTCGAKLVFGRYIVTAAHCVTDPPAAAMGTTAEAHKMREALAGRYHIDMSHFAIPVADRDYHVRIGSNDWQAGGRVVDVVETWGLKHHPEWHWVLTGAPDERAADVAVLQLAEYVDDQMTLPIAPRDPQPGEQVFRLGWGITEPDMQGPLPRQIRELRSQVIDKAACSPGHPYGWTPGDTCVGNLPGHDGDGVCSGDSGGPLMFQINGVWYTAGIVSRSASDYCGSGADIYTSTVTFRQFVYDTVRGVPLAAKPVQVPPTR